MKINISENGSGKEILILHGWGASLKSWQKVQDYLAEKGLKVIIPDMPGFGESEPPERPWNADDYINWLLDFIKNQKIETPLIIAGHSFGGGLAMKLAIEHPELIDKLILIGAARVGKKRSVRRKFLKAMAEFAKKFSYLPYFEVIKKAFYKYVIGSRDYEKAKGPMKETMKLIIKENLTNEIHKIKSPTLIIWGDKDRATPIRDAHLLNEKIENSKLEIFKGAGHALSLEKPEELAEEIYKFIS